MPPQGKHEQGILDHAVSEAHEGKGKKDIPTPHPAVLDLMKNQSTSVPQAHDHAHNS